MIKELNEKISELFESPTIKATFERVHVILALYIFNENTAGLGRYRLKEELLIGSGTARSLITKLKSKIEFIEVPDVNEKSENEIRRSGHVLTKTGIRYLNIIKGKIPKLIRGDSTVLKSIIIEPEETKSYIALIKNAASGLGNGIAQRDAAIKINGKGATCLVYDGNDIIFPAKSLLKEDFSPTRIDDEVQAYLTSLIEKDEVSLEKDDVIIIGLGDGENRARLVALNAALTLV